MRRQATDEQKQAASEKRAKLRDLAGIIKAMTDDQRAALAGRMDQITIDGHALSPRNACLIMMQCESATLVGGFRQWLAAGRCVRKGEHGMSILVPTFHQSESEPGQDGALRGFVLGTVFDVTQTDVIVPAGEVAA